VGSTSYGGIKHLKRNKGFFLNKPSHEKTEMIISRKRREDPCYPSEYLYKKLSKIKQETKVNS